MEVRLALLNRIQIFTKFKTIEANATEVLELIGYDEQGNAFSTLEGLKFSWKLEPNSSIS